MIDTTFFFHTWVPAGRRLEFDAAFLTALKERMAALVEMHDWTATAPARVRIGTAIDWGREVPTPGLVMLVVEQQGTNGEIEVNPDTGDVNAVPPIDDTEETY